MYSVYVYHIHHWHYHYSSRTTLRRKDITSINREQACAAAGAKERQAGIRPRATIYYMLLRLPTRTFQSRYAALAQSRENHSLSLNKMPTPRTCASSIEKYTQVFLFTTITHTPRYI